MSNLERHFPPARKVYASFSNINDFGWSEANAGILYIKNGTIDVTVDLPGVNVRYRTD
jgi:hypothetical protein